MVSFAKDDPEVPFKKYDLFNSLDFKASKLSKFLHFSSIFLPEGCFYLPGADLDGFTLSLASGASTFEMKLLPAAGQLQGLLLITVDEASLSKYEQEEED